MVAMFTAGEVDLAQQHAVQVGDPTLAPPFLGIDPRPAHHPDLDPHANVHFLLPLPSDRTAQKATTPLLFDCIPSACCMSVACCLWTASNSF